MQEILCKKRVSSLESKNKIESKYRNCLRKDYFNFMYFKRLKLYKQMNKKLLLTALSALVFYFNLNAQLLWKISGNGLTKSSYIFGTHHLIDKEQIKDFNKILKLSGQADAIVGEMKMDNPDIQMKLMQAGTMTDTTMRILLSDTDYSFADNELKQVIGVGLGQLGSLKPMMLSTLYSLTLYIKTYGNGKQPEGVDMLFQKNAIENNKKVIGLESIDDQIKALFNSIPLKRQAEILIKEMKDKDKEIKMMKQLNDLYLAGNLTKAEALDKEDDSMTQSEKRVLIDDRNTNWMKQLPVLFKEQCCFVAVGFMHFVGDNGLISQFKKAGYKVEPVQLE
jgi:uncharacterized protein